MQSVQTQPRTVDLARAAKELDLEWRLKNIPANAQTRGIHFHSLRDAARRARLSGVPQLDRILETQRRSYALYPVKELVEATAIAGALANADPREGMRELFRGNTAYVTQTWYGRVFTKYLAPNPLTALRWVEISHDYIENYGGWRLEVRGAHSAIMHHVDEYFWLDALRGACEGMLSLCGAPADVGLECDSPFAGRFVIEWQPSIRL
jgi:uncharacterized protein (TIGR02265 family)